MSKHNKLILIRGLPGSGKSTLAKKMKKELEAVLNTHIEHYEADMFFMDSLGNYNFDATLLPQAHAICRDNTFEGLMIGATVIVSNTFTTYKEIYPYFNMANTFNIPFEVHRCTSQYGSIHNVPVETINRMKARFCDYPGEICHE